MLCLDCFGLSCGVIRSRRSWCLVAVRWRLKPPKKKKKNWFEKLNGNVSLQKSWLSKNVFYFICFNRRAPAERVATQPVGSTHALMHWRSLIHIILWQNVSCLGRTQCASIPIQFRDHRRSLNCTTGLWILWGHVEQMVSFSTSIWPPSPFFFFFLLFLFPKGLQEESASGRWLWRHVAVWYISPKTCCLKASAVGGGGRVVPLMHRLLMPEYIPDHQGRVWTPFFLTSTQMEAIFSHRSQCCLQSARQPTTPTSNISLCMAYKCKYTAHRTFPLGHSQTDGRWW